MKSTAKNLVPLHNDNDPKLAHLAKVSLFEDLWDNHEALKAFAEIMPERAFGPHVKIIEEGVTGSEMFILTKGIVSVYKKTPEGDNFKVARLNDTQHPFFGEGGLISSEARSASIISETECVCLVLETKEFEKFCKMHSEWALPFYRHIAQLTFARLRKTNNDLITVHNALVAEIRGH